MEFFLNRYRNLSVLLVAILAQLALLAYQIKSDQDVRLIRVWAVTAVTPLARALEGMRSGSSYFFHDYFLLRGVEEQNRSLKTELGKVEMENQYLHAQLNSADNAKALAIFQTTSKSKTVAAHVIANTTDTGAKVIMVDRGAKDGVERGQAVRTPEGIVGKVIDVFPSVSYVLVLTDPSFAAGVVSQKHHVHGTLKGQGNGTAIVDYVQNDETVDPGEWFFTSGDDLIFPRGIPAGTVAAVHDGRNQKQIYVTPSGLQNGLEDVLIVVDGVHGAIPEAPVTAQPVQLLAPPPPDGSEQSDMPANGGTQETDLDRITSNTKAIGAEQHHVFGDQSTPAPNYNLPLPNPSNKQAAPPPAAGPKGTPGTPPTAPGPQPAAPRAAPGSAPVTRP